MSRYIDADKLKQHYTWIRYADSETADLFDNIIDQQPTADVAEIVRCKDCIHRPKKIMDECTGFDYEFEEEYACPGYCDDGYYAQDFGDVFYCAWGKKHE